MIKSKLKINGKISKPSDITKGRKNPIASISNKIPATFGMVVNNRIRSYFKDNYDSMRGWIQKSASSKYGDKKNEAFMRGDKFKIAGFGVQQQIYGSAMFGKRTGTLEKAISNRASGVIEKSVTNNGMNLNIHTGVDPSPFYGTYRQFYGGKGKGTKLTTMNELLAFSNQVSPDPNVSVFVQISPSQSKDLKLYIKDIFKITIRRIILRQL